MLPLLQLQIGSLECFGAGALGTLRILQLRGESSDFLAQLPELLLVALQVGGKLAKRGMRLRQVTALALAQLAGMLKRLLEPGGGFVAQLGQTKAKLQQTPLACCMGPRLRPKARFMNLAAPLRSARWCLRVLDRPWPKDEDLSARQRAVLATIDREQVEVKLGWLREYRQAIEEWSQWHEVIQVVVRKVHRWHRPEYGSGIAGAV